MSNLMLVFCIGFFFVSCWGKPQYGISAIIMEDLVVGKCYPAAMLTYQVNNLETYSGIVNLMTNRGYFKCNETGLYYWTTYTPFQDDALQASPACKFHSIGALTPQCDMDILLTNAYYLVDPSLTVNSI